MTIQRFFGISPGADIEHYYNDRATELSRLHPEIQNLSLRVLAHITVLPPFSSDETELLHAWADSVALESHPFKLEFTGFNHFGSHTFYLGVEMSQELNQLSHLLGERMMEVVSRGRKSAAVTEKEIAHEPFHPHVSLARHLTDESLELAREFFLRDRDRHFLPARVADFRLYRLDGSQYVVEQVYSLE